MMNGRGDGTDGGTASHRGARERGGGTRGGGQEAGAVSASYASVFSDVVARVSSVWLPVSRRAAPAIDDSARLVSSIASGIWW